MKGRFKLNENIAKELSKSQRLENVHEIEGFSERKYKKIDTEWYEAQSFNLGTVEEDEEALDLIEERVKSFVCENFGGKKVYLVTVDVTYAMEDNKKPIVMRVIVNRDDFKVENQNEIGEIDDLIDIIKDHENYFRDEYENLELGYSFGSMDLSQQLEDIIEGDSLQDVGNMWSVFYLDLMSEPNNIESYLSGGQDSLDENEKFHIELESRNFVRKDNGKIYEFL